MTAVLLWELDEHAADELRRSLADLTGIRLDVATGGTLAEPPTDASGHDIVHLVGADNADRALLGLTGANRTALSGSDVRLLLSRAGRPECVILDSCYRTDQAVALKEDVAWVIGLPGRLGRGNIDAFLLSWYGHRSAGRGCDEAFDLAFEEISARELPEEVQPRLHGGDETDIRFRGDAVEAPHQTRIWYGTNRAPCAGIELYRDADDALHRGSCLVNVPKSMPMGRTKRPLMRRLTASPDASGLRIIGHTPLAAEEQWRQVREALAADRTGRRSVLLYIHGYRTTFVEAALRAAQLHADLKVPGITAFFSWPSSGSVADYWADEDAIQHSERYLCAFLRELCLESGAKSVNVIAHSMGNRALLRVAMRAAEKSLSADGIRLGQVILAAADVGRRFFQTEAPSYRTIADGVTMYTSSHDKALRSSAFIHRGPRAGFTPPVTVVDGIHTIDASRIDLTLLGHGYYAHARPVLTDIHMILYGAHDPTARIGLEPGATPWSWVFRS